MVFTSNAESTAPRKRPGMAIRLMRWLAVSVLSLQAVLPVNAAEQTSVTPGQAYQLALEARTLQDYPAMLSLLRMAGEAGNLRAQEMLGSVLLAGSTLYGDAIRADPCEAARWIWRAALQGSAVAKHQRIVLNGMRDLPAGRQSCGME